MDVQTGAGGKHELDLGNIKEDIIAEVDDTYNLGADDKRWAAIYAVIAVLTSLTLGGIYLGATVEGNLFINASTEINGSLNISEDLLVEGNITASYFFGDGSNLSSVNFTELDPYWLLNYSEFLRIRNYALNDSLWTLNYSDYLTIQDYALNDSLWSLNYSDYLAIRNYALNDTDFNSTGLIRNWNASSLIIDWNATGFIADWTFTEIDPYWVANYSDYLSIRAYALNDSLWSLNYSIFLGKADLSDILGWDYYNSTNFDITDYLLDTTDTFTGNLTFADANNCIIFASGGKICSGV